MIHFRLRGVGAALTIATTMAACSTLRSSSDDECRPAPASALVPFAPVRALALAGAYDLTLVADSGPRVGQVARGRIALVRNDTLHRYYINPLGQGWRRRGDRPLIGWGDLHGDVGLVTAGAHSRRVTRRSPALPSI
jgi:hypothetical protein